MYTTDVDGKMEMARAHFQEMRAEADRERLVAHLRANRPSLWQRLFGRRSVKAQPQHEAPAQPRSAPARRKAPSLS